MILDDLTQTEFETVVSRMGLEKLVPAVNHVRPAATTPLKSERAIPYMDQFSLPWGEYSTMTKNDLWGQYVKDFLVVLLLRVKNTARESRTRLKFFRFNHPANSHNVRSLVFDAGGVFAVLMVRHCSHQTHKDRGTEVAEFTFRVEVGKFDN